MKRFEVTFWTDDDDLITRTYRATSRAGLERFLAREAQRGLRVMEVVEE